MKFHPVADLLPLLDGDEFDSLVADIKENGLLEPIYVHPDDGRIVDGRNRFRACKAAGVEPRTKKWSGKGSLVSFVWSQNGQRRHLTPSQKACFALESLPHREKEAARRKAAGRPKYHTERIPEDNGEARQKAAAAVGANPRYVSDAKKLREQEPDLFADVKAGRKSIPEAKRAVKEKTKQATADKISNEVEPLPSGPFRVIAIDPPWKYGSRAEDTSHRARNPYPDMELRGIKALPVADLAHDDCILWLWTTNAFMREAFECLDAWGFANKTILTWVKDRMGTGDWLRGKTEHCLMAIRGKPIVTLSNQTTALDGPMREHSRKPSEFYALVDSLCPGNKLEMFSRESRAGWQQWGVEKEAYGGAG